jgi:hypothetical protein
MSSSSPHQAEASSSRAPNHQAAVEDESSDDETGLLASDPLERALPEQCVLISPFLTIIG